MSENKNVFITKRGKKYHFFSSCSYIKGRKTEKIPLSQIKGGAKSPCSSCLRLLEKKGGNIENIDKKEESEEINEEKENNLNIDNLNINPEINENNNINFYSSNEEEKTQFEEIFDKNNNEKKDFPPSLLDGISGFISNIHNLDSKQDIKISKEKNIDNNKMSLKRKINNNNILDNNEEEEEDDEKEENNINNNIKEEYELYLKNNNKNSSENVEKLKYNLNPNLSKKDLNWTGKDFFLLDETSRLSKLLFLQKIGSITNPHNQKILIYSEKPFNNKENSINKGKDKGNFKFKFEITPHKELEEPIQLSVGFKIDYFEENNNLFRKGKKKIELIEETLSLIRKFKLYKKINTVHALLNISNGKFFIVGRDELEKRRKKIFLNSENSDILFLKNFPPINLKLIKDVSPIITIDINYAKLVNIEV